MEQQLSTGLTPEEDREIDHLVDHGFNYPEAFAMVGAEHGVQAPLINLDDPALSPEENSAIDKLVDNGGMNYTEARLRVVGIAPKDIATPALASTVAHPQSTPPKKQTKQLRGRNKDGSIDQRTLSARQQVIANNGRSADIDPNLF